MGVYGKYNMRCVTRDKYSMKQNQVLNLTQDIPRILRIFFVHVSSGFALIGLWYFELLLHCIIVYTTNNNTVIVQNCKWSGHVRLS